MQKKIWTLTIEPYGNFQGHVPTIGDEVKIAARKAFLLGDMATVDPKAQMVAGALAWMEQVTDSKPKDFDFGDLPDEDELIRVYKMIGAKVDSFRTESPKQPNPPEIPGEGEPGG